MSCQDQIDDEWTVTYVGMRTRTQPGTVVIAALEISPSGVEVPSAGVTQKLLRSVKLPIARRVLEALKRFEESIHSFDDRAVPVPAKTKTVPRTAKQLRRYLREYDQLCHAEDPHPAKTLARKHRVNRSTMRTWLRRAKQL